MSLLPCFGIQITGGSDVVWCVWIPVVVRVAAAWPGRCTVLWNFSLLVLCLFSGWGFCPASSSCWSDPSLHWS